jgi:ubiquinone/menaquinone biosynthesis C-methylase UbiE
MESGGRVLNRVFLLLILVTTALGGRAVVAQVAQQHPPQATSEYIKALEDPERDKWQQPDAVVDSLELRLGDEVADLGAGAGYFTLRLAQAVGPMGRVYAVDIDPQMLAYIDRRVQEEKLENVQTILADPHDPKLGSSSVDMIFVCNVLHHISDREKYYPLLARALRPGGRLVDIDFQKYKLPCGPSVEVKIAKKAVIKEVEPFGFRLVQEFDFLKYQYFLIFEH